MEFTDCKEKLSYDGIGIDLGIKDLAICSDTNKYKNINKSAKVRKLEKRKRRLQRSVSRKYLMNNKDTINKNNERNIKNGFVKLLGEQKGRG